MCKTGQSSDSNSLFIRLKCFGRAFQSVNYVFKYFHNPAVCAIFLPFRRDCHSQYKYSLIFVLSDSRPSDNCRIPSTKKIKIVNKIILINYIARTFITTLLFASYTETESQNHFYCFSFFVTISCQSVSLISLAQFGTADSGSEIPAITLRIDSTLAGPISIDESEGELAP